MSTDMNWSQTLDRLVAGKGLAEDEAAELLGSIMRGEVDDALIAAVLVALRAKGESAEELAGFVRAMTEAAAPIDLDPSVASRTIDLVGTGGDGANTFNISTVSAVVVAAAGVPVAKHGNRAASSMCGSADLLETWGIALDAPIAQVAESIHNAGIGFLFARTFHPAMRAVGPVRTALGIRTVFNLLGPLSNPARTPFQAVGVSDVRLAPIMADALYRLERNALVFIGDDGLDELTTTGPSRAWRITADGVQPLTITPQDYGLRLARPDDLVGGDAATNAQLADEVLEGQAGPRSDIVALNAGAALMVAGVVDDLGDGVELARELLASGSALERKQAWVEAQSSR